MIFALWGLFDILTSFSLIISPVVAKRSSIEDLVLMRTKLLKWSSFGPHFTHIGLIFLIIMHYVYIEMSTSILLYMHLLGNGIIRQRTFVAKMSNVG